MIGSLGGPLRSRDRRGSRRHLLERARPEGVIGMGVNGVGVSGAVIVMM